DSTSLEATPTSAPTLSNHAIINNLSEQVNQGSNVENGGQVYSADNQIYYIQEGIYCMSESGENITQISEIQDALYISKVKGTLYYVSSTDYNVYKLNITTQIEPTKLGLEGAYFLTVIGDFLYYQYAIGADADYCLYRANKDGSDPENLVIKSSAFCTDGKKIYYANKEDDNTLYAYNIATVEIEQLSNNTAKQINVVDNYLYYINRTTEHITKLNLDTQESVVLYDTHGQYLNNNGQVLVFADNEGISTMGFDGEDILQILEYSDVNGLNVVGDYIFFASYLNNSNEKIFYIKTDGTALSEPLPISSLSIIKNFDFENRIITVDFVERLSGSEAIEEYSKDFSLSIKNAEEALVATDGIYMQNSNDKQREYKVSDLTKLFLSIKTDGSFDPEGYEADCTILKEIYAIDATHILEQLFYITGFDGEVLELRQFYEE
ncbi:MAG: DUF5050 domain-containing protein, partial [Clostridiales bacterium]|nr:DUF5050 domain-containing protein [Clostridiales bacterium]